jgi:hypothetical protein
MKKLFIVYGMKRTGNHAIINWLLEQDKFVFFNNIVPIGPILDGKHAVPSPMDFNEWLHGSNFRENRIVIDNLKKLFFRNRTMMVSLEDHDLKFRPFKNVPVEVKNILLLRDPFNLLSSRIRKGSVLHRPLIYPTEMNVLMKRVPELWKSYAREFLGLTGYLDNKVSIYFNAWFSSESYRRETSQKLGFEFNDSKYSSVVKKSSGGSSFDGTSFNGHSNEMNVLNRGSQLSDSERKLLDELLQDKELHDLSLMVRDLHKAWSI